MSADSYRFLTGICMGRAKIKTGSRLRISFGRRQGYYRSHRRLVTAEEAVTGPGGIYGSRAKITPGCLRIYGGRQVIMGSDCDSWWSGKDQRSFRKVL
ncbi:MAG: hypothetical protein GX354_00600 [Firmicutes bacterium]|nr:hypothetical protein [Bacillota bacterium]